MITDDIIQFYGNCGSLRKTAQEFGVSIQKIRKILITAKAYTSEDIEKVQSMYANGYSRHDIARILKISQSTVHAYLPYTKALYNLPDPSKNAKRIRKCREKKKNSPVG